jgi:hypothetical protein
MCDDGTLLEHCNHVTDNENYRTFYATLVVQLLVLLGVERILVTLNLRT